MQDLTLSRFSGFHTSFRKVQPERTGKLNIVNTDRNLLHKDMYTLLREACGPPLLSLLSERGVKSGGDE